MFISKELIYFDSSNANDMESKQNILEKHLGFSYYHKHEYIHDQIFKAMDEYATNFVYAVSPNLTHTNNTNELKELLDYVDSFHGSGHEFWYINSQIRDKVYRMLSRSIENQNKRNFELIDDHFLKLLNNDLNSENSNHANN